MNTITKCVYGRKKKINTMPILEKKEVVISDEFRKEFQSLSEIKISERSFNRGTVGNV